MPHVLLEGACDLDAFWKRFEAASTRIGDTVLKASDAYANGDTSRVLVDCTVVEGYLRQTFLVEVAARDEGLLIHLFHGTRPEKSEGVRLCLGWIAALLASGPPPLRWAADNLGLGSHPFGSC
jgi:hypothetical protein